MAEEPEITSLYNGSVELRFTRAAHGYEVREIALQGTAERLTSGSRGRASPLSLKS